MMRDTNSLKCILKVGDILGLFSADQPEIGVTEISRSLDMSKSTVHRILVSLEMAGLIKQSPENQKYSLGFKVLQLADTLLKQLDLNSVAVPHMSKLRDETNETVALHVLQGTTRVCVTQIESYHELRRVYKELGRPLPLHRGSPGKAILAFLPLPEIEKIIALYKEGSEEQCVARETLLAELETIRQKGYAGTSGERTAGITSVSSPVFKAGLKVVGAINVSGPAVRFTEDKVEQYSQMVMATASAVSKDLGVPEGTICFDQ